MSATLLDCDACGCPERAGNGVAPYQAPSTQYADELIPAGPKLQPTPVEVLVPPTPAPTPENDLPTPDAEGELDEPFALVNPMSPAAGPEDAAAPPPLRFPSIHSASSSIGP